MIVIHFTRLVLRGVLALLWTLLVHYFAIRIPQLFRPKKRFLRSLSLWGAGLAWIMGVRITYRNRRDWPMGDLIVANHMGFLDVPVLLKIFPSVFVIKMEMRRVFYFGGALAHQGHLFVERKDKASRSEAGKGIARVLEEGDRIIVFPEGGASPKATRPPFKPGSFASAARTGKRVELCVIDYLPDRRQLEWDVNKGMFPQLVKLFGRHRTRVSVEFFESETVEDPGSVALRFHDLVEERLRAYDREREQKAAA